MLHKDMSDTPMHNFKKYRLLMGGDLPCRHGEAAFYLVSLAQNTGVSSGSSTAEGCHRIISGFGLFYPCEGITVIKFKFRAASSVMDIGLTGCK